MKPILPIPWQRLSAVAFLLFTVLISFVTTGCGGGSGSWNPFHDDGPDWESSHRVLENKIDHLKGQIESEQSQSERADFWRIVSAALITLAFFALVGGAALGSRARRDSFPFREGDPSDAELSDTCNEVV